MKRFCALLMGICLLVGVAFGDEIDLSAAPESGTATSFVPKISENALLDAPPINLNCAAALLMEPESGQIIFEMNSEIERPVASVTKVMTILLTLEAIESGRIALDQTVTISANAAGMGGSQVLLDVGEAQTVDILLKS